MIGVRHFSASKLVYSQTNVDGASTTICRAVNAEISTSIGAGVETLERTRLKWTVTYDEVLFIKEGEILIHADGNTHHCIAGDIVWLPKGTTLVYEAPERCTYFYALYPVDWANRQGVSEP